MKCIGILWLGGADHGIDSFEGLIAMGVPVSIALTPVHLYNKRMELAYNPEDLCSPVRPLDPENKVVVSRFATCCQWVALNASADPRCYGRCFGEWSSSG